MMRGLHFAVLLSIGIPAPTFAQIPESAPRAVLLPDTMGANFAAAATLYQAYGTALSQGQRAIIASFYDPQGVVIIFNGNPSEVSHAAIDARYRGPWQPPAYFRWDSLAFRPIGSAHVLVTGGFRWQSAGQADTSHFQYTAVLTAVDSTLAITFEQETSWPSR